MVQYLRGPWVADLGLHLMAEPSSGACGGCLGSPAMSLRNER